MLFVNFLKKNAEAGQAFFKKLLLVLHYLQTCHIAQGTHVPDKIVHPLH